MLAQCPVDDGSGKRLSAVFGVTCRDHAAERVAATRLILHDDHPHSGLPHAEDVSGFGYRAGTQHVDEEVVLELLVGARIIDEVGSRGAFGIRDEAGSTAAGPKCRGEHRPHEKRDLVIEGDVAVVLSVLVDPHPNGALLVAVLEPACRSCWVEDVAHLPSSAAQVLDSCARCGVVDERLGRH